MMALFQNLFGGQQQMGMQPQPAAPVLPRVPYRQNPMITTAGLALLGGRNINEGLANVAATAPAGMAAKSSLQGFMMKRQEEDAAKAAQRAAWNAGMKWKSAGGDWAALSPEDQAALSGAPDIAAQFMPKQAELPNSVQEYQYGQNDPAYNAWKTSQTKAGAPQVNVGSTNKYAETVDAGIANDFIEIQKAGASASEAKNSLTAMRSLMDDPNFYSGAGGESVLGLKRAFVALGGDPNATATTEAFNALAKKAALDNMGGSLGAGFSNADRGFVVEQTANVGNTPEGNKALIDINIKLASRKEQIAKMARAYADRNNGRMDYKFYDEIAQWAEANPLFPVKQGQPPGGAGQPLAPGTYDYDPETGGFRAVQ